MSRSQHCFCWLYTYDGIRYAICRFWHFFCLKSKVQKSQSKRSLTRIKFNAFQKDQHYRLYSSNSAVFFCPRAPIFVCVVWVCNAHWGVSIRLWSICFFKCLFSQIKWFPRIFQKIFLRETHRVVLTQQFTSFVMLS